MAIATPGCFMCFACWRTKCSKYQRWWWHKGRKRKIDTNTTTPQCETPTPYAAKQRGPDESTNADTPRWKLAVHIQQQSTQFPSRFFLAQEIDAHGDLRITTLHADAPDALGTLHADAHDALGHCTLMHMTRLAPKGVEFMSSSLPPTNVPRC